MFGNTVGERKEATLFYLNSVAACFCHVVRPWLAEPSLQAHLVRLQHDIIHHMV